MGRPDAGPAGERHGGAVPGGAADETPVPPDGGKVRKACLLLTLCVQCCAQSAHAGGGRAGFGAELPVPRAYLRQGCAGVVGNDGERDPRRLVAAARRAGCDGDCFV